MGIAQFEDQAIGHADNDSGNNADKKGQGLGCGGVLDLSGRGTNGHAIGKVGMEGFLGIVGDTDSRLQGGIDNVLRKDLVVRACRNIDIQGLLQGSVGSSRCRDHLFKIAGLEAFLMLLVDLCCHIIQDRGTVDEVDKGRNKIDGQ